MNIVLYCDVLYDYTVVASVLGTLMHAFCDFLVCFGVFRFSSHGFLQEKEDKRRNENLSLKDSHAKTTARANYNRRTDGVVFGFFRKP